MHLVGLYKYRGKNTFQIIIISAFFIEDSDYFKIEGK